MKKLLFLFFIISEVSAQEPYDYLEIIVQNGDSWVNIKPEPTDFRVENSLNQRVIKTINFETFLKIKPGITNPEGFCLMAELKDWRRASSVLCQSRLPEGISEKYVAQLAKHLSVYLFGDSLVNLEREKFIRLWISLSRAVIATSNHYEASNSTLKEQSKQAALIGELVWSLMIKSWEVEDIEVFSLHKPNDFSVNLLLDAGTNIMTKIIILPEVYYRKQKFCYDLVNKTSKDLKSFGVVK